MKLEAGNYIVKVKGVHFGSTHILRVYYEGRDKYFQFDASKGYKVSKDDEPWELANFKILEKLERKLEYKGIEVTVEFGDSVRGYHFVMKSRNSAALDRIKNQFPRMWKQFCV